MIPDAIPVILTVCQRYAHTWVHLENTAEYEVTYTFLSLAVWLYYYFGFQSIEVKDRNLTRLKRYCRTVYNTTPEVFLDSLGYPHYDAQAVGLNNSCTKLTLRVAVKHPTWVLSLFQPFMVTFKELSWPHMLLLTFLTCCFRCLCEARR